MLVVKNPPANAGDVRDLSLIPGLGRSPGGGHGNPLQYSCLENPMDRGAWWAAVHRVEKSQTHEPTCTCWVTSVVSNSLWPLDCTPPGPLSMGFSSKSPGVGCHFLLQRSFQPRDQTCLLHCRQILYWLSYQGSLLKLKELKSQEFCFILWLIRVYGEISLQLIKINEKKSIWWGK